jgi:transposase
MDFGFFIRKLKSKILELELMLKEAFNLLSASEERIEELEKENKELRNLVDKANRKDVPKTSRNSDKPPSKDFHRPKRTKERKAKSKKKTGGQIGHDGAFLKMSDKPDYVKNFYPNKCTKCKVKLDKSAAVLDCSKQEIDIPPLQPVVTQFNRFKINCECGKSNCAVLPSRLKGKVQYGPRVRTLINYSLVYQLLPFARLQEMLFVCFGIKLSQGTIFNTMQRTAGKLKHKYEEIKNFIANSEVVGADETVIFVGGKKWYNWVWQNQKATFISCEPDRTKSNIAKHFPLGFKNAILVSDRYSAHLFTLAKGHQICWAHLIRKINFIDDTEPNHLAEKLVDIYRRAKHLENLKTSLGNGSKKTKLLEADLNRLLITKIDKLKFPETQKLFKSLKDHRDKVLTFIYHKSVPSHNNASELAIRNAKVKMKISGCFRSAQNYFAVIRSLVDTMTKNNMDVFKHLLDFESGKNIKFNFD